MKSYLSPFYCWDSRLGLYNICSDVFVLVSPQSICPYGSNTQTRKHLRYYACRCYYTPLERANNLRFLLRKQINVYDRFHLVVYRSRHYEPPRQSDTRRMSGALCCTAKPSGTRSPGLRRHLWLVSGAAPTNHRQRRCPELPVPLVPAV